MSKTQVLVVEDENIVAKDVRNILTDFGYEVTGIASSGEEALQKAEEKSPDIVLMDIVLKGKMDGVEAGELLHRRFDIPIIYLTSYSESGTLDRAVKTEPFGYLLKPYEERELQTTIELALYRHRMERRLKDTQQWLTAVLRSIGDGVLVTDAQTNVRMINSHAEALTGWKKEDAVGKCLADVISLSDELTGETFQCPTVKAMRQGGAVPLPNLAMLHAKDRREFPVEGSIAAVHDSEGSFQGYVAVFRDVSERQRSEEVLTQMERQLRESEKMEAVGRLAGGIAHDFNNLLTAIIGNTSLLMDKVAPDESVHGTLSVVRQAADRAAELVKQLLGFSRRANLQLEVFDLNAVVREAIELMRPSIDPIVEIKAELCPELWAVRGDAGQIQQILLNLAYNGRDAMPGGGLLLFGTENVTLEEDDPILPLDAKPGEYVRLRVRDTGHGIKPEIRDRIFEPFFTTKEIGKGTGLGLAMVYGIVEQHHGWIDCRDEVAPGTQFSIYLPRYFDPTQFDFGLEEERASSAEAAGESKRDAVRSRTILLVDDEPTIRELGKTILEGAGYPVILAEDGVTALEIFQKERDRIGLVILDLTMPRLSGGDAFRIMLECDPSVHVIFSSGFFAADVPAMPHDHVLGFLGKPYHPDKMVDMVRIAFEILETSFDE